MYEYKAKLVKVVDGDTIDVVLDLGFGVFLGTPDKGIRVRLYGLNAPESRTKDKTEKIKGLAAKKYLENLLALGPELVIETKLKQKGKFGRILGIVSIIISSSDKQLNINEAMIEDGHAVKYYGGKR